MILDIIITSNIIIMCFLFFSTHPIFIGTILIIFSLGVSLKISLFTFSWLRFLIFYLISGGVFILLIYISCFRFNPFFKSSFLYRFSLVFIFFFFLRFKQFFYLDFSKNFFIESGWSFNFFFNAFFSFFLRLLILFCFFFIGKIITSNCFTIRPFYEI